MYVEKNRTFFKITVRENRIQVAPCKKELQCVKLFSIYGSAVFVTCKKSRSETRIIQKSFFSDADRSPVSSA